MDHHKEWEVVIGLEIHAALNTRSKLFSVAPNRFGDEPNTNVTEVCTGQPGALPVLNRAAVKKAVQFGAAINGKVQRFSKFDRKSYFYPDSPRNFQITQYDQPIIIGGVVLAEVDGEEHSFTVDRVHLEDDAGMLKHFPGYAAIDYNRAGVPLIEIVSTPTIHSAKEAVAYAMAIKAILQYIDISDCNMEEGSLRFDANVSVRKKGEEKLRNKIEIKNMNSFTFMGMAIESEVKRQIKLYRNNPDTPPGEVIKQATYRWDPERKETILMRSKEEADDYRYFPEPDLVPIILSEEYIEGIKNSLPELPYEKYRRYVDKLQLSRESAAILTGDKPLADFFEAALSLCNDPRNVGNWIIGEFAGRLSSSGTAIYQSAITPAHVAQLVEMIIDGTINGKIAKAVADDMVAKPGSAPKDIVANNPDYQPLDDQGEIEKIVETVLEENPKSIEDYKNGKEKAFAFLVGQVMKLSRGKAPPPLVNKLLKERLSQR